MFFCFSDGECGEIDIAGLATVCQKGNLPWEIYIDIASLNMEFALYTRKLPI